MRASPIASSPLSPKPTCPLTPITAGGFICVSLSLSLSLYIYIYIYTGCARVFFLHVLSGPRPTETYIS